MKLFIKYLLNTFFIDLNIDTQFQAIILHEHLERKRLERKNSDKEDYIKLSDSTDGIRPTHGR